MEAARPTSLLKGLALALLAGVIASPGYAECNLPPAPTKVPDAAVATEQEMIAAMHTLKQYSTDVANFAKCLEFEAGQNKVTREEQVQRQNAALNRLQAIAEKFNEQVRLFKLKAG